MKPDNFKLDSFYVEIYIRFEALLEGSSSWVKNIESRDFCLAVLEIFLSLNLWSQTIEISDLKIVV